RRRPLVAAAAGAYVAFLVHAAVDWDWQIPAVTLAALFCGGALLAVTRRDARATVTPFSFRTRAPMLLLTLAVAAFVFVGLRGNQAIARSEAAAAKSQWTRSASQARKATGWAPWSSRPWQLLGEAQLRRGKFGAARTNFRRALAKDNS